jgi:hypothetical protein
MTTRRQFLRRSGALAAAGMVSPSAIKRALAAASDASFVFRNGAVLTFDARKDPATCIAVRDDLIVYVGSDAGAADLIGPSTEVIDLKGRNRMHEAYGDPTDREHDHRRQQGLMKTDRSCQRTRERRRQEYDRRDHHRYRRTGRLPHVVQEREQDPDALGNHEPGQGDDGPNPDPRRAGRIVHGWPSGSSVGPRIRGWKRPSASLPGTMQEGASRDPRDPS